MKQQPRKSWATKYKERVARRHICCSGHDRVAGFCSRKRTSQPFPNPVASGLSNDRSNDCHNMVPCLSASRERTRVQRRFLTAKRSAASDTDCINLPLWRPRHDCTLVCELPRSQALGRARQTSAPLGQRCSCSCCTV